MITIHQSDPTVRTERRNIYLHTVEYTSDVFDGQKLDTQVRLNGQYLCVIAGSDIDKFHRELTALIDKYRI